jgi:hypothetical protein
MSDEEALVLLEPRTIIRQEPDPRLISIHPAAENSEEPRWPPSAFNHGLLGSGITVDQIASGKRIACASVPE